MLRRKSLWHECEITGASFEITAEQREAYEYFDLPLPTVSPAERLRHQLAFCGDHQLYWRRCAVTEKRILSAVPTTCPFPVLDLGYWRSDDWDATRYGRSYDFNLLFVDQLLSLWQEVPRPAVLRVEGDSSTGTHNVIQVNECNALINSAYCESCSHSSQLFHCQSCVDCHCCSYSQECYECVHVTTSTRLRWSYASNGCSDSWFLANCSNCKDCLFCANLSGAQYCIFNQPTDRATFERVVAEWDFREVSKVALAKLVFHHFLQEHPIPPSISDEPLSTSGNYLLQCDRTTNCFECCNCSNCIDCNFLIDARDCLDGCGLGIATEFCAQFVGVGYSARRVVNSIECWNNVEDLEYCAYCENSRHLFACVGLRDAEYCILNKPYSKEEYERIRLSIVALLKERDIWGRFLPAQFTPYEYNRSLAQVLMPLAKVPAQLLGFRWDTADTLVRPSQLKNRMGTDYHLSEIPSSVGLLDIASAPQEVFLCQVSGRPYALSAVERVFYRQHQLAPPVRCPEQRYAERLQSMAPRVLEDRQGMSSAFPADWFRPIVPYSEWKDALRKQSRRNKVN